jgi:glutathione peroxidase
MNRFVISILLLFVLQFGFGQDKNDIKPIYQFKVIDINQDTFDFASLMGKKIMVVNTASKCMFSPQYKELQELYETYKDSGLVVVAFPCNDFANREPKGNKSISKFCEKKYGVSFPLMAKISVKGEEQIPLYRYLTTKSLNGFSDNKVEWNFQKYLIGEEGYLEKIIPPLKNPKCAEVMEWIGE